MAGNTSYEVICYNNRPVVEINDSIRSASRGVDILQMDVDSIRRDNFEALQYTLKNTPELRVRILPLDPSSPYIARRAHQLGVTFAEQRQQVRRNIREIISSLNQFNFSLKVYDDYPTQITFTIDDSVYVSTIGRNRRSRELCTFKLNRDSPGVDRSFGFQFDALWNDSREFS